MYNSMEVTGKDSVKIVTQAARILRISLQTSAPASQERRHLIKG
jgi:hypothetical protein